MPEENLKKSIISATVWKFGERILAQAVSLIVSIIIARLLGPSEYGVVSIVTVFFAFANVIISGGLNTALIQKKDADAKDYNSVFTVSIIVAVFLYLVMFLAAPIIADAYHQPVLIHIIRVLGLSLPIYALKSIVCAHVSSTLQFRTFFFATLGGTLVSAIVGITMAVNGFGAWSLVAQQLSNTAIDTLILFCVTKLKLSFSLAFDRIGGLIKYGWKILVASLLGVTINQINPLFIGLKYDSSDLSFYTKGRAFPETLSSSMTYTISSVLFPVLARFQSERDKLLHYTRKYMQVSSFIVFPVMLGFAGVAENFVSAFLGNAWLPAVYYIRVVCLATMFDIVAAGNCETIKAMGRSDVFLKIEIAKKTGYFVVLGLFLAFSNSPEVLALSLLVCTVIQVLINSIPNRKLIGYKWRYQIFDLLPNLLLSIIMCLTVSLIDLITLPPLAAMLVQIFVGIMIYGLLAIITKNKTLKSLIRALKTRLRNR